MIPRPQGHPTLMYPIHPLPTLPTLRGNDHLHAHATSWIPLLPVNPTPLPQWRNARLPAASDCHAQREREIEREIERDGVWDGSCCAQVGYERRSMERPAGDDGGAAQCQTDVLMPPMNEPIFIRSPPLPASDGFGAVWSLDPLTCFVWLARSFVWDARVVKNPSRTIVSFWHRHIKPCPAASSLQVSIFPLELPLSFLTDSSRHSTASVFSCISLRSRGRGWV